MDPGSLKLPLGVACISRNSLFLEFANDKWFFLKIFLLRSKASVAPQPWPLPHALGSYLTSSLTNSNIYSPTKRDPPLPAVAPPSAHQRAFTPHRRCSSSSSSSWSKVWQPLHLDRISPLLSQYLSNLIRRHWVPRSKNRKWIAKMSELISTGNNLSKLSIPLSTSSTGMEATIMETDRRSSSSCFMGKIVRGGIGSMPNYKSRN